jgi:carboxyl-terminal processing protease
VSKALKALHKKSEPNKLKGLILDLRNNPGGVLGASIEVADLFLDEGLVVYTEGRMPSSYNRYEASKTPAADKTRMVVLINSGSASASEIVAGALQDQKRAVIMGTKTFGKGSVQTVLPLAKERAIKMTTARYYTPSGRSIQAQGIDPDIVVERAKIETIKPSMGMITEADLVGHLSNNDGESDTQKRSEDKKESLASRDSQLYEALNLLKGLHIVGALDTK